MKISIQYFGQVAELIGAGEGELDLNPNSSAGDLRKHLEEFAPELKEVSYTVAVNQRLVQDDHLLASSDELAILPPFAGG